MNKHWNACEINQHHQHEPIKHCANATPTPPCTNTADTTVHGPSPATHATHT